jgi:hypothetical protein
VGERTGELLLEAPAVEEPGQGIVVGEVAQLTLEAFALGDVERLLDQHPAVIGVLDHRLGDQGGDRVAVAAEVATLELQALAGSVAQPGQWLLDCRLSVVGMHEILELAAGGSPGASPSSVS